MDSMLRSIMSSLVRWSVSDQPGDEQEKAQVLLEFSYFMLKIRRKQLAIPEQDVPESLQAARRQLLKAVAKLSVFFLR